MTELRSRVLSSRPGRPLAADWVIQEGFQYTNWYDETIFKWIHNGLTAARAKPGMSPSK